MYFVNRSEIEQILDYYNEVLEVLDKQPQYSNKLIDRLALERSIHVLIEVILDVGNKMIDGFIMRDPGSYYDIIDILIDEKVIPETEESSYKLLIDARKMLVQHYYDIDDAILENIIEEQIDKLKQFSVHIRSYLDNELGVANAFSNESKVDGSNEAENNQR